MPIDASIYGNVKTPDPLESLGRWTNIGQSFNQNRLLQMDVQARDAISKAALGAMRPDGTIDPGKMTEILKGTPGGAYAAPAAAGTMLDLQGKTLSNTGQAITNRAGAQNLNQAATNYLGTVVGSFLNQGGSFDKNTILDRVLAGITSGNITPEVGLSFIRGLPGDPAKIKPYLADFYGRVVPGSSELITGPVTSEGAPTVMTKGQGAARAVGGTMPAEMPPTATGKPAQAGPGSGGIGAPAPGGGIVMAPPAGTAEAWKASADQYTAAREYAGAIAPRLFQLNKALEGLKGAGSTGPGTETRNSIVSFVQSLAGDNPITRMIGVDPSRIASYDEAVKYLTQYASAQGNATGIPKTNEGLAAALTGNASTKISNLAAQDVVKANMALERMRAAQIRAFEMQGGIPNQYANFAAKWSTNVDPRAFAFDLMDGDARKKLLDSIKSPKERQKFLDTLNIAVSTGILDPASFGVTK